ncbi:SDR family oxidoreductase [Pseudomonas veronii]|uniref:SDR family oxidoreductase n=1 Tax=Pseudomonas veronii TaxID=76761 RepID=UPI002D79ED98|nr:SDR family oxidoreductase [Pseudomonas veronii]WRU62633.1 SDR family oxidoreductase [Pseudomonas veronii]
MPNNLSLLGKVALVTGGSRSIGASIAKRLAKEGATVAITYGASSVKAAAVVWEIESLGGRALAIEADAGNPNAVRAAVALVAETFGPVDILVNSAGIMHMAPIESFAFEDYQRMLAVNVTGAFVAAQEVSKMMIGGRIINIGSVMAHHTAFANFSVYALTKGALQGFTHGLARDLGPKGITVNTIMPGPTHTDLNPKDGPFAEVLNSRIALGRYGEADEVASIVAFLAGPGGAFITGTEIIADGGLSA